MNNRRLEIVLVFLLIVVQTIYSNETHTEINIDFRVNSSVVDTTFSDNASHIHQMVDFFNKISSDTTIDIVEVSFCGSASPEGSYQINHRLSRERLYALENLIRQQVQIPDSLITHKEDYIPWDHLREEVENSDMEFKDEIIAIIDEPGAIVEYGYNAHIDHRVLKLQRLDGGRAWKVLFKNYFEDMRHAYAIFITYKKKPLPQLIEDEKRIDMPVRGLETARGLQVPVVKAQEFWHRGLHLKTNALTWGVLLANIAAEIDIVPHLSFTLPVYYSALNYFTSTIKFRSLAIQPEVRYWLSEDNIGFFAGAHFGLFSYNIALHGDKRYQDHDGNSPGIGGGISVGYRMPISKDNRWNIEFTVGAGVYDLYYDEFYNTKNGKLIRTTHDTYWGIDNVGVNISYRFDINKIVK